MYFQDHSAPSSFFPPFSLSDFLSLCLCHKDIHEHTYTDANTHTVTQNFPKSKKEPTLETNV